MLPQHRVGAGEPIHLDAVMAAEGFPTFETDDALVLLLAA
jgi:hypothetical protein